MSDFDLFKNIPLLSGLGDEHVKELFALCGKKEYAKGEIIMEEDEAEYSMFFFLEGEVVISSTMTMKATGKDGGKSEVEKSLVKLSAGQVSIIGEMSILEDLPRSATVKAFSSCVFYEISRENFLKFVELFPVSGVTFLLNISRILCNRVRRSNRDIIKLGTALSIALSKS